MADGADALGVAGGDGSLALVASAAAARMIAFVCVPAGTRNHFARDVGVAPNDLVGVLDAFGAALERTIDLGYVNGRPFLSDLQRTEPRTGMPQSQGEQKNRRRRSVLPLGTTDENQRWPCDYLTEFASDFGRGMSRKKVVDL